MLLLAVEKFPNLTVSKIELDRRGVSYTIDTLIDLQSIFPHAEFTLTLGMDALLDLENWKKWKEVLQRCHIAIACRPGIKTPSLEEILKKLFGGWGPYTKNSLPKCEETCFRSDFQRKLALFRPQPKEVSSHQIRSNLLKNRPVKYLLPPKVEQYIITNRLYQTNPRPCKE